MTKKDLINKINTNKNVLTLMIRYKKHFIEKLGSVDEFNDEIDRLLDEINLLKKKLNENKN